MTGVFPRGHLVVTPPKRLPHTSRWVVRERGPELGTVPLSDGRGGSDERTRQDDQALGLAGGDRGGADRLAGAGRDRWPHGREAQRGPGEQQRQLPAEAG